MDPRVEQLIEEAMKTLRWHLGGQRVAKTPILSQRTCEEIVFLCGHRDTIELYRLLEKDERIRPTEKKLILEILNQEVTDIPTTTLARAAEARALFVALPDEDDCDYPDYGL